MNIDDVINSVKPSIKRLPLMLNGDLEDQILSARQAYRQAVTAQSTLASEEVDAAKTELDRLEAQADAETVVFVFHSIPSEKLDGLKLEHPPSTESWERYKIRVQANPILSPPEFEPDAFMPALIAASCVEPEMSYEKAQKLIDTVSDGNVALLFDAAWSVNMKGSDRPLSRTATSGT